MEMVNKQILFLPSSGNHVKIFYPILKAIQKNHNYLCLTQGSFKDEGTENELHNLKIPFTTIDKYPKLDPSLILEQENIGLIIVGHDFDVIPQWFINSANKKQIPSILIQDGLLLDIKPLNNDFFHQISLLINKPSKKLLGLSLKLKLSKQIKKISYGQAGCTQIHVWNEIMKNFLIKKGVPQNSIYVTGNVKFSDLQIKPNNKNQSKKSVILYAPTDLIQTKILEKKKVFKIVDEICQTIFSIPHLKLIIKPHPIEEKRFYDHFIQDYGSKVAISEQDITTLIHKSKFLITNLSAVALDALQQKKQVIIFLPEIEKIVNRNSFPFDLIEKDILIYAKDSKELHEKILYLLENSINFTPSQIEIISNYIGQRDDSVFNIVNSINEIMKKS